MAKSKVQVMKAPVEKLLYRRKEAAFALGMSLRTIDYAIANRQLRASRHGGNVHIPAEDVKRLAADIIANKMPEGRDQKRA